MTRVWQIIHTIYNVVDSGKLLFLEHKYVII